MKSNLIVLAAISILAATTGPSVSAQDSDVLVEQNQETKNNFQFGAVYKTGLPMDVSYEKDNTIKKLKAIANTRYRVIGETEDRVLIEILPITQDASATKGKDSDYINSTTFNAQQYFLRKEDVKPINKLQRPRFSTGTLLLPLKFRGQLYKNGTSYPWQLSTDITVGQYAGYRFRSGTVDPAYVNVIGTLGVSTLNINSDNTAPEDGSTTLLGITASCGIVVEVKGIQLGFVFGRDFAPGTTGEAWIYNEENWLSFGVGLNFLSGQKF
jgi:hypothetical protein